MSYWSANQNLSVNILEYGIITSSPAEVANHDKIHGPTYQVKFIEIIWADL